MVLENIFFYLYLLISILTFIVVDLDISFIKLFSDSSKYFGDIFSRMMPPDFSNFKYLIYEMLETIEIAFSWNFYCNNFINSSRSTFRKELSSPTIWFS